MAHYFIDNNPQPDGAHEVHTQGCVRMTSDKQYLGEFTDELLALMEARKSCWTTAICSRCVRNAQAA